MALPDSERRGVVLLAVLIVLGVVGTLLMGSYFAERERWSVRLAVERGAQLQAATQSAMADVLTHWDSAARFQQEPGTIAELGAPWPDVPARVQARITRASTWSYRAAVAVTDSRDSSLSARAARVVTVHAPRFPAVAVLVAADDVIVDGTLAMIPADSAAASECGAPLGPVAGVAIAPGRSGPSGAIVDSTANQVATYTEFGDVALDSLVRRADLVLPGGSIVAAPVGNIIHATGNLTLTGGHGSGLLLVDGGLRMAGEITFEGVIVVAGGVEVVSGAASLTGVVLVAGTRPSVSVNANAGMVLHPAPCVVQRVAWHAGTPEFVKIAAPSSDN